MQIEKIIFADISSPRHSCLSQNKVIGEHTTTIINAEVTKQIKQTGGRKGKAYTVFTDEDWEKIGKHAANKGNNSAPDVNNIIFFAIQHKFVIQRYTYICLYTCVHIHIYKYIYYTHTFAYIYTVHT